MRSNCTEGSRRTRTVKIKAAYFWSPKAGLDFPRPDCVVDHSNKELLVWISFNDDEEK